MTLAIGGKFGFGPKPAAKPILRVFGPPGKQ